MKKFIKVMKALSDPSRVKVIKMLQHKEMCVCEIQEALGIAQSTASKHLKILEEAGLATYKKEGLWVNYALSDGTDSPYAASILGSLRHWLDDDPQVAHLNSLLPGINREQICASQNRRSSRVKIKETYYKEGHVMDIKILGPGCPKCTQTAQIVKQAVSGAGVAADVEKVTDVMKIASYGVFKTPAVVIDGEVKSVGKIPKKEDVLKWIK